MDENNVLSSIQSYIQLDESVTSTQLVKNLHLSPKEAEKYLKKFQDQNKEYRSFFLDYSSEDKINHTLTLSQSSKNGILISLQRVESDVLDLEKFYNTKTHQDSKNPPISSSEIHLIPTLSNKEIKKENPDKSNELKSSRSEINIKFIPETVISNKRSGLVDKSATHSTTKESKEKATFFKQQPKNEELIKTAHFFKQQTKSEELIMPEPVVSANNFDSDFDLSDSELIVPKQTSPVKSKHIATKAEMKTENDVKCKNTLKKDKSKSRLFENFENVSHKRVLPKRRRLVIESDEEDNDENVLVEASFEEKKSSSTLKSHPSKRYKSSDDKRESIESDEAPIKKQIIENVCKPGFKKIEKTYKDEDGFLVVEKVLVPINGEKTDSQIREDTESFHSTQSIKIQSILPAQLSKIEKKIGKKSKKVESQGKQTNIMNFFQKNT